MNDIVSGIEIYYADRLLNQIRYILVIMKIYQKRSRMCMIMMIMTIMIVWMRCYIILDIVNARI